jgi:hypothetical protein
MIYTTDEIDKYFSAASPGRCEPVVLLGGLVQPLSSVEGTVAKRAGGMRLC